MVDYNSLKQGKKPYRCRNCLGYFKTLDVNGFCSFCGQNITSRNARKKLYGSDENNNDLKKYFD